MEILMSILVFFIVWVSLGSIATAILGKFVDTRFGERRCKDCKYYDYPCKLPDNTRGCEIYKRKFWKIWRPK